MNRRPPELVCGPKVWRLVFLCWRSLSSGEARVSRRKFSLQISARHPWQPLCFFSPSRLSLFFSAFSLELKLSPTLSSRRRLALDRRLLARIAAPTEPAADWLRWAKGASLPARTHADSLEPARHAHTTPSSPASQWFAGKRDRLADCWLLQTSCRLATSETHTHLELYCYLHSTVGEWRLARREADEQQLAKSRRLGVAAQCSAPAQLANEKQNEHENNNNNHQLASSPNCAALCLARAS